jgi:hypothetical protein
MSLSARPCPATNDAATDALWSRLNTSHAERLVHGPPMCQENLVGAAFVWTGETTSTLPMQAHEVADARLDGRKSIRHAEGEHGLKDIDDAVRLYQVRGREWLIAWAASLSE